MKGYLLAAAAGMMAALSAANAASADPAPAAQAGKRHFIRCVACHSMSAAARPMTGPHLEGIVGRRAASLPDFTYSDALRDRDFVWDEERLDAFLKSPQSAHPGMCLTFNGLPRPEDRAALIAYLKHPVR
ncbi:MAG: c-type cytochrome [Novosphingobium sp.]|nr:c-type cytochrome [Novosphingobium sp.]